MLEKIAGIENRYAELNQLLMKVGDDYQRAAELSIERAELEPIIEIAQQYRQALERLEEARTLQDVSYEELRELAVSEINELEPQIEALEIADKLGIASAFLASGIVLVGAGFALRLQEQPAVQEQGAEVT